MIHAATLEAATPAVASDFEYAPEARSSGLVRRFLVTQQHLAGLLTGAFIASVNTRRATSHGFWFLVQRAMARLLRPLVDRRLVGLTFPVQFRRRLELLGPTYIKLGQILSLREDLLPTEVTNELKNLLDRLPVVRFEQIERTIVGDLGLPLDAVFAWVDPVPLASASIAQTHRAITQDGESIILKVVKPGIRDMLRRDAVLLRLFARLLNVGLARYQPRRILNEFVYYTLKEADLRLEADNAETFAANFKDAPDIVFPRIYRQYSGRDVLCMEFLDGIKPTAPEAEALPEEARSRLIDLGAKAIIRMLYQDGFFHADLHPGNLLILEGPRCGFIDLGMVGRFDEGLRRTLLRYYYCLVTRDSENAARFLTSVAEPGKKADPKGFRREVEDISRRWAHRANFKQFSLARLILESLSRAGHFGMYFPVELVLMVKALVTFEGVGEILKPGFDVAAVSKPHVSSIVMAQLKPIRIAREALRNAPDVIDALVNAPLLVTEGLRFLEKATRQPPENPLAGVRGALLAGFCVVAAAIVVVFKGPWLLSLALFLVALSLAFRRSA
ncbi:MAG: ABC1 kinase family protein [Bacteroidales bacterium]